MSRNLHLKSIIFLFPKSNENATASLVSVANFAPAKRLGPAIVPTSKSADICGPATPSVNAVEFSSIKGTSPYLKVAVALMPSSSKSSISSKMSMFAKSKSAA